MKTIKWGIIGAGNISSKFITALKGLDHTEVAAVASRDLNRAKEYANRFAIKSAYGSYEELVKDPEVDVIYIGTPHTEHKANCELCITNGKSVLCEKPFTINQKEAEELIQLAKKHNVFLMEAMWTKFLPVTAVVKKWMKEGRIGEVRYLDIAFGFRIDFNINNRLFNPTLAGGALLDVGVYPITYAVHLLEQLPDRVLSSAILGRSNVDEMNSIIFCYENGILANISSAITAEVGQDAIIVGDQGKIRVPNFWMADYAEIYDKDGKLIEAVSVPHKVNGYEYEAEVVNCCIREEKLESKTNTLTDTLDVIRIMDEIRKDWGLKYPTE